MGVGRADLQAKWRLCATRFEINPEFAAFLDKSAVGLPGNGKHPLHGTTLAGARGRRSGA
jgi:hypothetical protein